MSAQPTRQTNGDYFRQNQKLAASGARRMLPIIQKWFTLIHTAILYGVKTQLEMGLKPIKKGVVLYKDTPGQITAQICDWKCVEENGKQVLKPVMLEIVVTGANAAKERFNIEGTFTMTDPAMNAWVAQHTGELVREITSEMRANIRTIIGNTVKAGHPVSGAAREIRRLQSFALTTRQVEYVSNYRRKLDLFHGGWDKLRNTDAVRGVLGRMGPSDVTRLSIDELKRVHASVYPAGAPARKVVDSRVASYTRAVERRRSYTIARTEAMQALNEGEKLALRAEGIQYVEWLAAVDACPICQDLDSRVFRIIDAPGPPVHPNCRCSITPRDTMT